MAKRYVTERYGQKSQKDMANWPRMRSDDEEFGGETCQTDTSAMSFACAANNTHSSTVLDRQHNVQSTILTLEHSVQPIPTLEATHSAVNQYPL